MPVPGPWKRAKYSVLDIWRLESIPHSNAMDVSRHVDFLEPLTTARALADEFECDPATIRAWAREGTLPSIRLGGSVRFHTFAVRRALDGF